MSDQPNKPVPYLFNKYGVPSPNVIEDQIFKTTKSYLKQLVDEGHSLVEVRAIGMVLIDSVSAAVSEVILRAAVEIRKRDINLILRKNDQDG